MAFNMTLYIALLLTENKLFTPQIPLHIILYAYTLIRDEILKGSYQPNRVQIV